MTTLFSKITLLGSSSKTSLYGSFRRTPVTTHFHKKATLYRGQLHLSNSIRSFSSNQNLFNWRSLDNAQVGDIKDRVRTNYFAGYRSPWTITSTLIFVEFEKDFARFHSTLWVSMF